MREVDQELFDAVKQDNLGRVKRCLDRGANIHAKDDTNAGKKPMHIAAETGHINVIEFFLSSSVNVNVIDKEGRTSLYYAAWKGHLEAVKFLISKGANIDIKNNDGKTPLDIAREEGHMEIVNILDGIETEITESESSSVCSSLEDSQEVQESDEEYFESERDELEVTKKGIIEYLKHRCSDVFTLRGKDRGKNYWHYILIDSGKEEVFLEQCKTGSIDAADYGKILYSGWGENPPQNIEDKVDEFFNKKVSNDLFVIKEERENKNAYHYVLIDPDKREMFLEQSKIGSALARDIEDYGRILYSGLGQDPPESISDRIERAYFCTNERDLKEEFANLSVKDSKALHDAARNGELEALRGFVREGVNVNSTDKNGWTSLHHAAYVGNLEVVKYLIDSWASLHVEDTVCGRKPVHIAAREGNTGIVKLFLSKGVGANDADKNSWTPLHYAAWNGHLGTANLLINKGADIHAKDAIRGKKPIHIAAEGGCTSIIELFVSSGISIDDTDKEGRTLLYYAAWKGHLEAVKFLAGKGANIHAENTYGTKPIHVTTMEGHREIIEFLLSKGVDVDDTNKNGWTPLHWAAQEGKLEIAKFLIEEGADINAKNNDGKTPLDIARKEGHTEILDILDDPKTGRESPTYTSLHDAAKKGDLEAIKYLIRKGADVNDPNEDGWTPLHCAASEGESEVAEFLISKGANIHAKDNTSAGKKPIHVAAMEGCTNIVELFLSRGVDVDDPDKEGRTSLYYAAWKGQLDTVEFLVDKGANVHAEKNGGVKPIHAATDGHQEVIGFLLSKGASVDDRTECGWTPLHFAAQDGQLEVTKFLIEKGADIHVRDNDGKTPLNIARENGHREIVGYLTFRIGKMFSEQDKYSKARQAYQEAFDIQKVVLGPDHPDTLGIRHNMAAMLFKQGKYSEALKIFQAIFEKRRDVLGPDHPDTLGIRHNMAAMLFKQGKYSKALKTYQEVFEKRRDVLGPDHPDTLLTRHSMAVVLDDQGKYSEALKICQEVFEKRRDVLGPDHPDTLSTRHNMAVALKNQGKCSEALKIYQAVFDIQKRRDVLGPDHPDTLLTRHNMAVVLKNQGKYSEALKIYQAVFDIQQRRDVLGPDHPDTLSTRCSMAVVLKKQGKYTEARQVYQEVFDIQKTSIKLVKQGLYLPSFRKRGMKMMGKCSEITRGLSQALFLQSNKSFLNNLGTSVEIYERIAQGKQISEREEREVFALSKLLDNFRQQLIAPYSLPPSLMYTVGYKIPRDLSNYIAEIEGDFAIHLITSNHVVAIYRIGDNYAYFDSNTAFVSRLKNVDQLMQVVEKGVKSAGYQMGEKGFLVEHFDVAKANSQLSNEDKQILAKEIKTERQLLAGQDKEFGLIKINGQELSRVQLYDFGTKISAEGGVPLLINADMNLSSKKFQDHLDKKEVSMTAREYLDHLKDSKNVEEVVQATRLVPFEGSKREIEEAEQTRKLKGSSLEQLVKGTINSILAAVSLTSASQSESQLSGKTDNRPETYLNDPIVDKQLQRLPGH